MVATATVPSDDLVAACRRNLPGYRARCAESWRHIEPPDICEWVESSLRFGASRKGVLESRSGPLSYRDRPWWRFPLRCLASRTCRSVALPACTQIGKTANLDMAALLYFAEFRPAPAMVILPDENEAKLFRDRVYAIVEESAKFTRFQRIRIPPVSRWNVQEISLGSMLCHLAWAGSKQRTRGKPCWYVFFVECDVYPDADKKAGDPIEAGKGRTGDVFSYKHVFESSPRQAPSAISDEEATAEARFRWYGECPHCGTWQEIRFFPAKAGEHAGAGGVVGIKAPDGEYLSVEEARERAYYGCVAGCKITNEHKGRMMESGRWAPLNTPPSKTPPPEEPEIPRTAGFHLWAAASPNETWGSISGDYIKARKSGKLVDWYGNRLGKSFEHQTKVPSWYSLGKKAAWTHARRTVPAGVWFLTAGIDVQGENNGVRYVIRGWAPGRTSWLIDWGWVERKPGDEADIVKSDMAEMERLVLQVAFPVVDEHNKPALSPFGRRDMRVKLANIDSNYLPKKVHDWLRSLPESWVDRMIGDDVLAGRARAIRGDHTVSPDVRFRHSLVETNSRSGEKYEGGLHQWGICIYPYYDQLTEHVASEPGKVGSWYLTADILQGREYLEQLTNFHYVITVDPRRGKKGQWTARNHRIPVDFWDCEIYAEAAAEMCVGSLGWDEAAWEEWRKSTAAKSGPKKKRTARAEEYGGR